MLVSILLNGANMRVGWGFFSAFLFFGLAAENRHLECKIIENSKRRRNYLIALNYGLNHL